MNFGGKSPVSNVNAQAKATGRVYVKWSLREYDYEDLTSAERIIISWRRVSAKGMIKKPTKPSQSRK